MNRYVYLKFFAEGNSLQRRGEAFNTLITFFNLRLRSVGECSYLACIWLGHTYSNCWDYWMLTHTLEFDNG